MDRAISPPSLHSPQWESERLTRDEPEGTATAESGPRENEAARETGCFAAAEQCQQLLARGEVTAAFDLVRETIARARAERHGEHHLIACSRLARLAAAAHDADSLSPDALARTIADLDAAEETSRTLGREAQQPWHPITFGALRSRTRALDPARRPEALTIAREALALARATYSDLIPEQGRALAERLLETRQTDDALALLHEVEPEAASRGMVSELSRIRAVQVRALVQQHATAHAIDERMVALRDALAATESHCFAAETRLALAIALPPSCAHPDVLALAEHSQVIFSEIPLPAEEARAIETAGDVLRSRGLLEEARQRHLRARARLHDLGLGLRIPLLDRKLAGPAAAG